MLVLTLVALVAAQPSPAPLDISAFKDKLRVLTDGQGHYVVYDSERPIDENLFYGDGKTFHRQRVIGGGMSGDERWDASFWDPRNVPEFANYPWVAMSDFGKAYQVVCSRRKTPLTKLKEADARAMIDAATFLPPPWSRMPERLLRDDSGHYFFVDRLRTPDPRDRRDFRVFMGSRGKMKQLPLKDIVDDSEGTIFATADGVLRLVAGTTPEKPVLKWVVGKKETSLIEVPLETNARMIYLDLGPYSGARLGTPCDDLM